MLLWIKCHLHPSHDGPWIFSLSIFISALRDTDPCNFFTWISIEMCVAPRHRHLYPPTPIHTHGSMWANTCSGDVGTQLEINWMNLSTEYYQLRCCVILQTHYSSMLQNINGRKRQLYNLWPFLWISCKVHPWMCWMVTIVLSFPETGVTLCRTHHWRKRLHLKHASWKNESVKHGRAELKWTLGDNVVCHTDSMLWRDCYAV